MRSRRTPERSGLAHAAFAGVAFSAHPVTGARDVVVAVIIGPAHPVRIAPLLMAAYQLTEREQDVTSLVLQGASTHEIADALFISSTTVQQHLKRMFEKTSVRSRRDLVGKVFFAHYEPRVRDNEQRASVAVPLRGLRRSMVVAARRSQDPASPAVSRPLDSEQPLIRGYVCLEPGLLAASSV
jgi:DNA-binding CsgD family transcriptional regulator